MKKLKKITPLDMAIGAFAFIVIAHALGFGLLFAGVYFAVMVGLLIRGVLRDRRAKGYVTLSDVQIARGILLKAHVTGKIDRMAYVKGELYLTREANIKRMALGSVRRGSRIDLEEFEKQHRYF